MASNVFTPQLRFRWLATLLLAILSLLPLVTALRYGIEAAPDTPALNYTVALLSSKETDPSTAHFARCGGVLVSARSVLTSARCIQNETAQTLSIRAGSRNRMVGGALVPVSQVTIHPEYNSTTWDYDIAVLTLENDSAVHEGNATPARIGSYSSLFHDPRTTQGPDAGPVSGTAALYGWGLYNYSDAAFPETLLTLPSAVFVRQDLCADIWHYIRNITARMICDYPGNERASWEGDRGGPLVDERSGEVLGLLSFSILETDLTQVVPEVSTSLEAVWGWVEGVVVWD
ncbi:trypsin-like cysteine/serine peptidase domain-containing protein [Aspergillus multicolor]|uniref:S1 family serine peptidase n=1 Tax=Aspergillus multicolor TaxID=41759 RepID=UPI003CCCCB20